MADIPTGRALDETVAKAMGLEPYDGMLMGRAPNDGMRCRLASDAHEIERQHRKDRPMPRYSTDPATDPEKVVWLIAQFPDVHATVDTSTSAKFTSASVAWGGFVRHDAGMWPTRSEAIARLVVAVARWRAGK